MYPPAGLVGAREASSLALLNEGLKLQVCIQLIHSPYNCSYHSHPVLALQRPVFFNSPPPPQLIPCMAALLSGCGQIDIHRPHICGEMAGMGMPVGSSHEKAAIECAAMGLGRMMRMGAVDGDVEAS